MKINHIRLILILLCITMIPSLSACGSGEVETTASRIIDSTEGDTSVSDTSPPVQDSDAESTEKTTEEPTENVTEEITTEAVTTEAVTTEEITEAITEDPAVLEIVADIPEFFDKNDIFTAPKNSGLTSELTDGGVMFVNPRNKDGNFTLFTGRGGGEITGQYFFIKYRASQNTHISLYTATDVPSPTGFRCKNLDVNNYLITDEKWHVVIIDVTTLFEFPVDEAGNYCALHLKLDIEGGAGIWAEIAYVGYTDDLADIKKYVQATESSETIQSVCPCISPYLSIEYNDKDTHAARCSVCGKAQLFAHTGANYGRWSTSRGYYLSDSACTICGEKYNFASNIYVESENIKLFESAWATGSFVNYDGDITYTQLYNTRDAGIWSAGYFHINPHNVASGQYLVVRYRVPINDGELTLTISADTLGGHSNDHNIPLIVDNVWHTAVIDMSLMPNYVPSDAGAYAISNSSRILTTSWGPDDVVQIDWFRMYDSFDRIPEEYLQETVITELEASEIETE